MKKRLNLEEVSREIVKVVLREFPDIAADAQLRRTSSGAIERLRIFLKDGSFVDVCEADNLNAPVSFRM